jgi:hypothetical protein
MQRFAKARVIMQRFSEHIYDQMTFKPTANCEMATSLFFMRMAKLSEE